MVKTALKDHLKSINIHTLPPQTRRLVGLIGLAETIRLLQARGGTPTYIPKQTDKTQVLLESLKPESVAKLSQSSLAGYFIDLPKADKLLQQIRNLDILNQRGMKSKQELAKEYNLTTRRIQSIWSITSDEEIDTTLQTSAQQNLF